MLKNLHLLIAAATLFVILTAFIALEWYGPMPQAAVDLGGKLPETQQSAMELIIDLSKLFMGWSLAVIGGIGYFLRANLEKDYPLSRTDLFLCESVILTSLVSIFFGHLSIGFVTTMLILEVFDLKDLTLAWYQRTQYLAFLTSLLLFGGYIHSTFYKRIRQCRATTEEKR